MDRTIARSSLFSMSLPLRAQGQIRPDVRDDSEAAVPGQARNL